MSRNINQSAADLNLCKCSISRRVCWTVDQLLVDPDILLKRRDVKVAGQDVG